MKRNEVCRKCPNKGMKWVAAPGDFGETVYLGRRDRSSREVRWCMRLSGNDEAYNDMFSREMKISEWFKTYSDLIEICEDCPFYAEFFVSECCSSKEDDDE